MVGLKERTVLSAVSASRNPKDGDHLVGEAEAALAESGQVGWRETIFGRTKRRPEVDEERAEGAWMDGEPSCERIEYLGTCADKRK